MVNFLKKHRFLILVITTLVFILLVVFYFVNRGQAPIPSASPSPSPFNLERIIPSAGVVETAFPTTAINFYFSLPVDKSRVIVKITPFNDYEVDTDKTGKVLFLRPVPEWKFNTNYKITLTVTSKDGQTLEPIEYSFTPRVPKDSPLLE